MLLSKRISVAFIAMLVPVHVLAWNNGLVRVPTMGWSSWNAFACDVSADLILETANALEKSGLRALGYVHVNIDDCWALRERSAETDKIVPDPAKFPLGIGNLSASLRQRGFGLGIYSDAGNRTCQDYPGSYGHEQLDAETFADWGIDFLKLDWCGEELDNPRTLYPRMQAALQSVSARQQIVFAMCEWGWWNPWDWASSIANSWRTNNDIFDRWLAILRISETRILHNLWMYSGPGLGWNDADSLEVGNGKLTLSEERSHFALWCFWNSPLILGNDVRKIPAQSLEILGNRELIAINQDPFGQEARLVMRSGLSGLVWARQLANGDIAVLLWNRFDGTDKLTISWPDIWLSANQPARVRDLQAHKDLGEMHGSFSADVAAHDCVALRLAPL